MMLVVTKIWQYSVINAFAMNEGSIANGELDRVMARKASVDDEFTNDIILVSLTQEATLRFKEYSIEDFPELKLARVSEMTENLASRAELQVRNDASGKVATNSSKRVDIEKFRRILQLELSEPSKEAVLEAISILEKREDVRSASPNYIGEYTYLLANDTFVGNQWALNNVQLPQAWHLATGSNAIRIGIVDSGIDRGHPDLTGRINEGLSRDHSGGGNPWGSSDQYPLSGYLQSQADYGYHP